jgi:rhodanese-related sulfurtransferase
MFRRTSVPEVTVDEVDILVDQGALLIDVRELSEWNAGRIPRAELKPLSTINDWWPDLPRDRTIVVACRTGQRSAQVVQALISQGGFDDVHNMTGGIVAWAHAGRPVDA